VPADTITTVPNKPCPPVSSTPQIHWTLNAHKAAANKEVSGGK